MTPKYIPCLEFFQNEKNECIEQSCYSYEEWFKKDLNNLGKGILIPEFSKKKLKFEDLDSKKIENLIEELDK